MNYFKKKASIIVKLREEPEQLTARLFSSAQHVVQDKLGKWGPKQDQERKKRQKTKKNNARIEN